MIPVQQAVSYIQLHLGEDLRLKQLAKQVHLSPSHLIRLFRARLHYSPHEFIICMRMDRAKYLLKSTDLPIKRLVQKSATARRPALPVHLPIKSAFLRASSVNFRSDKKT